VDAKIYLPELRATLAEANKDGIEWPQEIRELGNALVARNVCQKVNGTIGRWDNKNMLVYAWGSWRDDLDPYEYYRKVFGICKACGTRGVYWANQRTTWDTGYPTKKQQPCQACMTTCDMEIEQVDNRGFTNLFG
jgi:hypothetical protein